MNSKKRNNIVLIDRDGTLNSKIPGIKYITSIHQIKLNLKLLKKLKKFPNIDYICITNQAGVAKKLVTKTKINQINMFLKKKLKLFKINIIKFYVSYSNNNRNNYNRKPNPGLFFKGSREYGFNLKKTFYIGDDERDIIASKNAKTKCYYLGNKVKNQNKIYRKTLLNRKLEYYLKLKNNFKNI